MCPRGHYPMSTKDRRWGRRTGNGAEYAGKLWDGGSPLQHHGAWTTDALGLGDAGLRAQLWADFDDAPAEGADDAYLATDDAQRWPAAGTSEVRFGELLGHAAMAQAGREVGQAELGERCGIASQSHGD